jgi:4-aminobutyrate aminotransferase-like enzyme
VRLAKEVASTMPDPLSIAFFVNSGTEATELALRLARNYS